MSTRTFGTSGLAVAVALASAALSTQANAQSISPASGRSISWSKSEAIIGAPSALEAILANQGAAQKPIATPPQPASLSRPQPSYLRNADVQSEAVTSGKPDVFGSVALRVGKTSLDRRWRQVKNSPVSGSAAEFAKGLNKLDALARLEAVNKYVNKRVAFTDDSRQFGRPDVWSAAGDTLKRGRGDCEDYAIAKMQMLRRAGISDSDLYLVIVKDLVRRADHAVLVVRAGGQMNVLDNGTDEILNSEDIADYRPVLTFASSGEWTHGYRIRPANQDMASKEPESVPDLVPAASAQRSRSASLLAFNTGFSK